MNPLIILRKQLDDLEEKIAETRKRLPAHSAKPPVMMDLLALEDEYDAVMKQIETLKQTVGE
jgi:hypothetical protein